MCSCKSQDTIVKPTVRPQTSLHRTTGPPMYLASYSVRHIIMHTNTYFFLQPHHLASRSQGAVEQRGAAQEALRAARRVPVLQSEEHVLGRRSKDHVLGGRA